MIPRKRIICLMAAVIFLTVSGRAAPPNPRAATRPAQVAMITWRGETEAEKGFLEGMNRQGRPFVVTKYHADQDPKRLAWIIQAITELPVDLIYVFGTTATQTVLKRITTTPVVFNIVSEPVSSGVIQSWERSGNNATGCSNQVPMEHQLKALKKIVNYRKLGVLYNPRETNSVIQRNLAADLQDSLEFQLIDFKIESPAQVPKVMPGLEGAVDAVYLPADSLMISLGAGLAEWINRFRLPSLTATESMVTEHGLLLGLQPSYLQLGLLAAEKAGRILDGEEPGRIPTSHLDFFYMPVNLRTARQIGVQVPMSILMMADKIVR